MHLIVGLGNPGLKYTMTRHNIGFLALDLFAKSYGAEIKKEEHKALTLKMKLDDQEVLLAKPMTYMNLSGESIVPLMQYYKIDADHILVLHDEVDQGFGQMKMQKNRGPAGHNGLKSLNEQLGHQNYGRLRLGVGRPTHAAFPVADYVLQNFSPEEQKRLPEFLERAGDAIEGFVFDGFERTAEKVNQKSPAIAGEGN